MFSSSLPGMISIIRLCIKNIKNKIKTKRNGTYLRRVARWTVRKAYSYYLYIITFNVFTWQKCDSTIKLLTSRESHLGHMTWFIVRFEYPITNLPSCEYTLCIVKLRLFVETTFTLKSTLQLYDMQTFFVNLHCCRKNIYSWQQKYVHFYCRLVYKKKTSLNICLLRHRVRKIYCQTGARALGFSWTRLCDRKVPGRFHVLYQGLSEKSKLCTCTLHTRCIFNVNNLQCSIFHQYMRTF